MSQLTRRRRSLLHWLVSTCLVLAMIVQPVLASIGEMHELAHGLAETHVSGDDHDDVRAELAAQGEAGDREATTLHLVHHMAHCCGQTAAPAVSFDPAVLPEAEGPLAICAALERPADEPRLAPFRPPIQV
jgi:hypothetical protein